MGEETPENSTEEKEEIEEYTLIEEPPQKPEPKTTDITIKSETPKEPSTDMNKCPYCGSRNIGKDLKFNVYKCFTCGKTYVWEK